MANGYIGKISAVVTANTSDLERKLSGAVKNVDVFANRLAASIERSSKSAQDSLNSIFTPLQRLERNLQAGLSGNVFKRDNVEQYVRSVRQAVSISEQINKPLAGGAAAFQKLSLEVQAGFLPALNRAQSAAVNLSNTLQQQGGISERTFGGVEQVVNRTTEALRRLGQAQQLAVSGFSGNELQFTFPRAFQALQSAAASTSRAAELPPSALADGNIQQQAQRLQQFRNLVAKTVAEVEEIRLRPNVDQTALAAAERRLDSIVETTLRAREEFDRTIGLASGGDDAKERIARASSLLTIDTDESDRLSRESALTKDRGLSEGLLRRIKPSLVSIRDDVANLADPLRESVGPAVDDLTNRFKSLARQGVGAAGRDVQKLKADIQSLRTVLESRSRIGSEFASSFGGAGSAGLSLGVDQKSLRSIGGEVEFVQQRLAGLASSLRGPVLDALDAFRVRASELFSSGALDTSEGRAEIEALRGRLVQLLATAENSNPEKLAAALKRVGDVARGAGSKLQLGIQQAIFAFDDFFSVTGGLDQRIRAAGNNISQLGFILGETKGLIVGVGIAVGAQLIASLVKFASTEADTEDKVRSLNDALARQKSLAEGVAEAFRDVADAISRAGFSPLTQSAREQQKSVEELQKRVQEEQRERVASLDFGVQEERANQADLQKRLEAEADPGERVRLERELRRSRDREKEFADRAVSNPGITPRQAVEGAADAILRSEVAALEQQAATARLLRPDDAPLIEVQLREDIEKAQARRDDFVRLQGGRVEGAGDLRAQTAAAAQALEIAIQQVEGSITTGITALFDGEANAERRRLLVALETQRVQLEKDVFRNAANAVAVEATKTAIEAANGIGNAIDLVADALGDGPSIIRKQLEDLTRSLLEAEKQLEKSRASGDVGGTEAAKAQIEALNQQRRSLESAAASLATFAAVLDRVSNDLNNTVSAEARSAADRARREENAAGASASAFPFDGQSRDLEFAADRRARLEREAQRAEERRNDVEAQNRAALTQFEKDVQAGRLGEDAAALVRVRDAARSIAGDASRSEAERAAATLRAEEANASLLRFFEDSPEGRRARDAADAADIEAQRAAQADDAILRGRELASNPAQRAGRELADNLRALSVFYDNEQKRGAIGLDAARIMEQAGRDRVIADALRSQAPAIAGLADSVANAVLQGPSRAALSAADVSTVEGARELNRLIRGDDAARDQNLEELRRQSEYLKDLVETAKRFGEPIVAN